MQAPTILAVNELSVNRSRIRILDRVSWTVRANEHWVILGANGSGKTSLLSALTGYLTPTGGDITLLRGRYGATDWRTLRKKIGLVSSSIRQMMSESEPALTTIASGKDAMIGAWGKLSPADQLAATRILRAVQGEHLAERPWGVLSQGERQRILIGRALMARPRVLILDEPCAGLDPVAREHFLLFLQRLGRQRHGPSLLLVTHHVEEIMPIFTHALLLRNGIVLAQGRLRRVLTSVALSRTFDAKVRVVRKSRRYTMRVIARRGALM